MLFERNLPPAPLSNDQILKLAPSVFADHKHASRGDRYAFISTAAVLEGMRNEGFQPFTVAQTRCRIPGKSDFTKHLMRFRHPDALSFKTNEVGEEIPEIVLINSHDGTSSYQIMGGVLRKVCSNGMVVGDTKYDVKVRHTGNIVNDVIEGSFRVIEDMKEIAGSIDEFKAIQLSAPEQIILADAAHALRWERDSETGLPKEHAPVVPEHLLSVRRPQDLKDDLWTTFNRVQENIIKGGLEGINAKDKKMTTRAVAGVSENVKLNRALWVITQRMAELKA